MCFPNKSYDKLYKGKRDRESKGTVDNDCKSVKVIYGTPHCSKRCNIITNIILFVICVGGK